MNLFHCPWLRQLPQPTGHFSTRERHHFGYRRRTGDQPGDGDGDGGLPRGCFGGGGW